MPILGSETRASAFGFLLHLDGEIEKQVTLLKKEDYVGPVELSSATASEISCRYHSLTTLRKS